MKLSLSYVRDHNSGESGVPDHIRDILIDIASGSFTPKDGLSVIAKLFPDRVEILETAWKSADDSVAFRDKKKAFELLWKLATEYWSALVSGSGDAEARNVFGNAYSARESETVEANKRARRLRTLIIRGKISR